MLSRRAEASLTGAALALFSVSFIGLTQWQIHTTSATADETVEVPAGIAILQKRDFRMDPVHAPLIRAWAAIPSALQGDAHLETRSREWATGSHWMWSSKVLFHMNDADRLLIRGRTMVSLLGLLLGVVLFLWARELFGVVPATAVLLLFALEPNILAHSSVVKDDLGVSCFIFLATYGFWRLTKRITLLNVGGTALAGLFAVGAKFSGVVVFPIGGSLLLLRALQSEPWPEAIRGTSLASRSSRMVAGALILATLLLFLWGGLWGIYGFRYSPDAARSIQLYAGAEAQADAPRLTAITRWIDRHHLLPNAATEGLLALGSGLPRKGYLLGVNGSGWWYFFPFAILVKTPLAILLGSFFGALLCLLYRPARGRWVPFVLLPIAFVLIPAMTSRMDIGLRYVLPAYPFLLLLCGVGPSLARGRWRAGISVAMVLGTAVEVLPQAPHWLAFFNLEAGGPANGHRLLVDSNLDWGQDLKDLAAWMRREKVAHLNLAYSGSADPAYYGIQATLLPPVPPWNGRVTRPVLPGYVAISASVLHGINLSPEEEGFYAPFLQRVPDFDINHSTFIYRVDAPWWTPDEEALFGGS
jgi:hypothetical protein